MREPRLWSLRGYYLTTFIALGAFGPFFPRWLEARGIQGLAMGLIVALTPAFGVVGPPIVGFVADALGLRGYLMRVACLGALLGMGGLTIGAGLGLPLSYAAIFLAVLVYGAFRAPMTMMADVMALERAHARGASYGRIRLWGSIGFLFAALGVGRFIDVDKPAPLPAVIAAALCLSLIAAFTLPAKQAAPTLPVVGEARALIVSPDFALFLLATFVGQIGAASYDLCVSLHLRKLGAGFDFIGLAWALGTLSEVVLLAQAAPLVQRFGATRLLGFAFFGAAFRWMLLSHVESLPALLVLQPLHAVSFGVWWVASVSYTRSRAPAHALATAQGLFSATAGAGSVVGMLIWGGLYRRSGGATTFGAACMVSLVAGALAIAWDRRLRLPSRIPCDAVAKARG